MSSVLSFEAGHVWPVDISPEEMCAQPAIDLDGQPEASPLAAYWDATVTHMAETLGFDPNNIPESDIAAGAETRRAIHQRWLDFQAGLAAAKVVPKYQ
jgi:hypothetical protein